MTEIFNIARGRVNAYVDRVVANDPANSALVVVLLKTAEADATLIDYATLSALLTAGGGTVNVEANFTNYTRKILTNTELSAPTVDNTTNEQYSTIPILVYANAGGATNNSVVKMVICYDADTTAGTDANLIPLTVHDTVFTTDGNPQNISAPANGFFGAS